MFMLFPGSMTWSVRLLKIFIFFTYFRPRKKEVIAIVILRERNWGKNTIWHESSEWQLWKKNPGWWWSLFSGIEVVVVWCLFALCLFCSFFLYCRLKKRNECHLFADIILILVVSLLLSGLLFWLVLPVHCAQYQFMIITFSALCGVVLSSFLGFMNGCKIGEWWSREASSSSSSWHDHEK